MEKDGLITRQKGSGRSKVEVTLTEKGLDVFNQSLHNETDKRIFSVLTKRERERLASYLFKLRGGCSSRSWYSGMAVQVPVWILMEREKSKDGSNV